MSAEPTPPGAETQYFTLEQANLTVAAIRPLVEQILAVRQKILDRRPELWPALQKAAGNGGNRPASEVLQDFERLDALVRQIQATGAILRDPNTGLVDFLAQRDERPIYLCWRYPEEEITHWHELDAGFSGRQRL